MYKYIIYIICYFIPIGTDCTVARILKQNNFRVLAFPFDWIVCPLKSTYLLLSNKFESFMEKIVILESENRMLFDENNKNMKLIVSKQKIYPVIDVTYDILFPHDFYNNDETLLLM